MNAKISDTRVLYLCIVYKCIGQQIPFLILGRNEAKLEESVESQTLVDCIISPSVVSNVIVIDTKRELRILINVEQTGMLESTSSQHPSKETSSSARPCRRVQTFSIPYRMQNIYAAVFYQHSEKIRPTSQIKLKVHGHNKTSNRTGRT